jgi:hypothetical protein
MEKRKAILIGLLTVTLVCFLEQSSSRQGLVLLDATRSDT